MYKEKLPTNAVHNDLNKPNTIPPYWVWNHGILQDYKIFVDQSQRHYIYAVICRIKNNKNKYQFFFIYKRNCFERIVPLQRDFFSYSFAIPYFCYHYAIPAGYLAHYFSYFYLNRKRTQTVWKWEFLAVYIVKRLIQN